MVVGVMGAGGIASGSFRVFGGGSPLGSTPPCRVTPRQGNADLWAVLPVGPGTARRRRAAGKDPEFRGGSPLGRDPGVQRHPDGCVVHAFRGASRSGADLEVGVPYRAEETAPPNTLSPVDGDVPHPPTGCAPDPPKPPPSHPPAPVTILPGRRGVAQSGRAPGSGSGGRRFKSCRPDAARPHGRVPAPRRPPRPAVSDAFSFRPFPPRKRAVISALTHGSNRVYSGALAEDVCPGECPFSCSCFLTFSNRM